MEQSFAKESELCPKGESCCPVLSSVSDGSQALLSLHLLTVVAKGALGVGSVM